MPDSISEESNIDDWLTHFEQQGQYGNIRDWRQGIEDKEALSEHRPPRLIRVDKAVKDFRQALLTDEQYSKSATSLLRKLNRPKPPIVELWKLQNPANRPDSLTPEEQVYVDRYDRSEQERRKWCVEISLERWERWGTLDEVIWDCTKRAEKAEAQGAIEDAKDFTRHAETARNELHADLAKVGEQWMAENPELARQLVEQFTGKSWVKSVPTEAFKEYRAKELAALKGAMAKPSDFFSDAWAASPVFPQEAFYRGRLYFIAANLILKYFGLNDAVAASVIEDIRGKALSREWDYGRLVDGSDESEQISEPYQEKKVLACEIVAGRAYLNLYEELQEIGIVCTTILEKGLSDALNKLLNDPDQMNDLSLTPFSEMAEVSDNEGEEENGDNLDNVLWEKSKDFFRNHTSPDRKQVAEEQRQAQHQHMDEWRAALHVLKKSLNPRQLSIILLIANGHTHDSIAQQLGLNPKTIQRERRKIEDLF